MRCPHCGANVTLALVKAEEAALGRYADARMSGASAKASKQAMGGTQQKRGQSPDMCQCGHWKSAHAVAGTSPREYATCGQCNCPGFHA